MGTQGRKGRGKDVRSRADFVSAECCAILPSKMVKGMGTSLVQSILT